MQGRLSSVGIGRLGLPRDRRGSVRGTIGSPLGRSNLKSKEKGLLVDYKQKIVRCFPKKIIRTNKEAEGNDP